MHNQIQHRRQSNAWSASLPRVRRRAGTSQNPTKDQWGGGREEGKGEIGERFLRVFEGCDRVGWSNGRARIRFRAGGLERVYRRRWGRERVWRGRTTGQGFISHKHAWTWSGPTKVGRVDAFWRFSFNYCVGGIEANLKFSRTVRGL